MWALDETALELVQRTWYNAPFVTGIEAIDAIFPRGICARSVVEIYGDAFSPKSLVLWHLMAAFLVQKEQAAVYYFDIECMLDMQEIHDILVALIKRKSSNSNGLDYQVERAKSRLHIYHSATSKEWSEDIQSVQEQLLRTSSTKDTLLVIDCISSFHLIDKVECCLNFIKLMRPLITDVDGSASYWGGISSKTTSL